jgi:ABC-type branched-chain amino acid transport systems, ATPase component
MELLARYADHVVVLSEGHKVMDGKPEDVFLNPELMEYNLTAPIYMRLAVELQRRGFELNKLPMTEEEAVSEFCVLMN